MILLPIVPSSMSPDNRSARNDSRKHHQLAVRQRQNDDLERWCKLLGRLAPLDPRCRNKDNNNNNPGGGKPDDNKPPPTPPATQPATTNRPQPTTTNNTPPPTPPRTTTPAPVAPTQTPRPTIPTSPTPSTATSSQRPPAGTPQPDSGSEQPGPSPASSSPQAAETSSDVSGTSLAVSGVLTGGGETSSRGSSLVPGTPTTSTFTSVIVTSSDGVELTVTSTGVTVVTPQVPAPTDLDSEGRSGSEPPGSGSVGASSKSTNVGAIVGGVLGALALLVLCAFVFLLYQRRKRKRTAPSSEFIRRYGHTALNTPRDSNSASASNLDVSQMRQAPEHTQNSYHSFPYHGEKT
ncbi:hypothetical protein BKA70DRAFT_27998 [Coprinopsis sp. MPI-PUGE-AT-0042]|nr:hypothetical protein BKA70DRAFT_27998 [Coprinopsis sp. MPI-PUGE-AT-0042]